MLSLLAVLLGLSGSTPSRSAAQSGELVFVLQTASGVRASGPLEELGEQWRVRLGGPRPVRAEANDLVELRRAGGRLPRLPDREHLIFVNGDRVPGDVLRLAGERLVFRPRLFEQAEGEKPVALPVSALSVIWLGAPDGADQPDRLRRRLASAQRARDVVYLRNGDAVEGALTDLDDKTVQIEVEKRVMDIPRERVAAVALNTELTSSLRPKEAYGRLVLANGGRLSLLSAARADRKTLSGVTLFQAPVQVPLDEVIALYLYQGKAVYLSDLKPLHYEHAPFAPTSLLGDYTVDASFGGRDLRTAGNTHDKGLGLHSSSRLTIDLAGGYRRFEALVGLDDRSGRKGSVRVRVLVDDKPQDLDGDRELTGGGEPLAVRVNVTGAKKLTLVVEFGRGGSVQDDVNWLDARLIQ